MATWCLIKEQADKFKQGLKSGEIDPGKLAKMSSAERRAYLEKFVGEENAKQVNALFESKLLLKNQKAGMISWAKRVAGMKPEIKRDLITRIERLDKVLDPATEEAFLQDLASTRLGVDVTAEESKKIFDLSNKIQDAVAKRDPETLTFKTEKERLEYGAAKVALNNYVNELKLEAENRTLGDRVTHPVQTVSEIAGVAKSLKASFDNSAIFRQGWKTLWTNPRIWLKNAAQSFVDFAKTTKDGDKVMDGVMADIVSRPNYERMVKAKLAIGNLEEAFPSSFPEKMPLIGRIFKGSETAFTGFIYRQRADVFDSYIGIMERSGLDINNPTELEAVGKLVNSLTGRGNLGRLEPSANVINNVFFSPRFLKSHVDVLTAHTFDTKMTPFARKQAVYNLVKIVGGTAAILLIAKAINNDSVELDPRSADFGKIKVGNTRFDVSGGMSSIVTLVARLITQSTKSSTTGTVKQLNTGEFGSQTGLDVVYNFFENKLSPVASVVRDVLKGEDFNGDKPTILGELNNLYMPLPVTNTKELYDDPNSAPLLLALMADAVGIGTNTYGSSQTNWSQSTSKEMLQFREKVGDKEFKKANDRFNELFNEWAQEAYRKPEYQNLSDDGKADAISKAKEAIKKQVFKEYGFKPKTTKKTPDEKKESKTIKSLLP